MKTKNIETLVLAIGLVVIGLAIFMMFSQSDELQMNRWANLIFAVGFLCYILYSILSTNNLNQEIRQLNNHISSLKDEIKRQNATIAEKDGKITQLQSENKKLNEEIQQLTKENRSLQKELSELSNSSQTSES